MTIPKKKVAPAPRLAPKKPAKKVEPPIEVTPVEFTFVEAEPSVLEPVVLEAPEVVAVMNSLQAVRNALVSKDHVGALDAALHVVMHGRVLVEYCRALKEGN